MTTRRLIAGLFALCACSTKIAQTTYVIPPAMTPSIGLPPTCGPTLKERLTVTSIQVDADIRYKLEGINRFPLDERIAFSAQPNGMAKVAWLDNGFTNVHVTPLNVQGTRLAADTVVEGIDLGGLIAHDDGFTILTRRDDPGDPINDDPNEGPIAKAAFLVRYQNGAELFGVPLTGTKNITDDQGNRRNDCSTTLQGRLAYNGSNPARTSWCTVPRKLRGRRLRRQAGVRERSRHRGERRLVMGMQPRPQPPSCSKSPTSSRRFASPIATPTPASTW